MLGLPQPPTPQLSRIALRLTPTGRLQLDLDRPGGGIVQAALAQRLADAFSRGSGSGLWCLGAREVTTELPPDFAHFRAFATRYIAAIRGNAEPDTGELAPAALPEAAALGTFVMSTPPMAGGEYLNEEVLSRLWDELHVAFKDGYAHSGLDLQGYLKTQNPVWNLVGRVCFNLAENRRDPEHPFAFMATYTARLSSLGKPQHVPLGQALQQYAGARNHRHLLSLLVPVQRAAEQCAWLQVLVDSHDVYQPLAWTVDDAAQLLHDVPALEQAGVVVRMPASWRGNRPPRPTVRATVGSRAPAQMGNDALLDFQVDVTLDGTPLTAIEIEQLLAQSSQLAMIRGQWVEIDRARLKQMLGEFRRIAKKAKEGDLTLPTAMRLLTGADILSSADATVADAIWGRVDAGPWLSETLAALRGPNGLAHVDPGSALKATLRPYQQVGVRWLYLLSQLNLGACLADDMGLGKTIQVLALLLILRAERKSPRARNCTLIVSPASLLGNWAQEIQRFAPDLKAVVAHPSVLPGSKMRAGLDLKSIDVVVTTYGSVQRNAWLRDASWDVAVLDEAQAIKNPDARQTRAVKQLDARVRFALTGTPVENRLGDLWSIFDFTNPGLLGSSKAFSAYTRRLEKRGDNSYGPLRELVRPYILRRLKTDRSVISDLPDKTEVRAFCALGKKQAVLYQQAVDEFAGHLRGAVGIQRKGLIFQFLMRFKQICNHPSHWLSDGDWTPDDSGKFHKLREIAEVVAEKQEKMLVFTQFRETTAPLAGFLASVFGRSGLVLHGDTAISKRRQLVQQFQADDAVPFFVLSLKAGGSGLNLTAASHVVHFDRWWNPAVENQATDRAYRIGQRRNVLVHKFVCRGTIEEKIDTLIEQKRALSDALLEGSGEINLTEMKDQDLLALVSLNLDAAAQEL